MDFSYPTLLVVIASYLLGSVPFGLVLTRMAGLGDIREIGSGNIGATNVLRTGRKDIAVATLLLDAGKGAIAVLLALYSVGPHVAAMAGAAAFIGHCYPLYLKFQGGKGVATFMGTIFAVDLMLGLLASSVWLLAALIFRMSSLAALIAATAAPLLAFTLETNNAWMFVSIMTLLIFVRHVANIKRILNGSEPKIGAKNKA